MPRITWGESSKRVIEAGLDRGVLYVEGGVGVPWVGLISVSETPSGGETSSFYIDGVKYYDEVAPEDLDGNIEAYMYPEEFEECDGSGYIAEGITATEQDRSLFDLTYRTFIGDTTSGYRKNYKIHLIYNAQVAPSSKRRQSLSEAVDPTTFSWPFYTTPIKVSGLKPTAHFVIDSRRVHPDLLLAAEDVLYGSGTTSPTLPSPDDLALIIGDVITNPLTEPL